MNAASIDAATYDLPDGGETVVHRSPQDIMDEIAMLELIVHGKSVRHD